LVWFGSIQVSSPLSGEPILHVGLGMGLGHLVRVLGLRPILPGLFILVDLAIHDIVKDAHTQIINGKPFLATATSKIDVK